MLALPLAAAARDGGSGTLLRNSAVGSGCAAGGGSGRACAIAESIREDAPGWVAADPGTEHAEARAAAICIQVQVRRASERKLKLRLLTEQQGATFVS